MKGQFSLITIISAVVMLILYVAFLPLISNMVSIGMNSTDDQMTQAVLVLFPFLLLIGIIVSLWQYRRPQYEYVGG